MDVSFSQLLDLLPERAYYENELKQFKAEHRMLEWLSVRVLLFHLLDNHHVVLYHQSGRPYILNDEYYISISHTKGYVAVIISQVGTVAIDIEQYGQRVHRVASKFMRDDEAVNAYNADTTWSLLLHWSAKERSEERRVGKEC